MKITCEHCGTTIDVEKEKKCPSCHAPYSDNKEYKKLKDIKDKKVDYDFREREADIRKKEITNQILEKEATTIKKMSIIPFAVFIFGIIFFIFIFRIISNEISNQTKNNNKTNNTIKNTNNKFDDFNDIFNNDNKEEVEEEKQISFNENASMKKYEIKCDDVREYKYDWYEKGTYRPDNIKYYAFHIVFKNTSNENIILYDNIQLLYTDDKGNENIIAKTHIPNTKEKASSLELYTKSNSNYSGNVFYEIPNYVKNVKIKYDKVTIDIKEFRKK